MNPKLNYRGPTLSNTNVSHMEADTMQHAIANNNPNVPTLGKSEKAVQRKFVDNKKDQIQRKNSGSGTPRISNTFQSSINSSKGAGRQIESDVQGEMSSKFGADFSGVRVHHNKEAHELASEINSRAFTVGQDIYFGQGEYRPNTKPGKHLLAHELTHVVQQSSEVQGKKSTSGPKISKSHRQQVSRWKINGNEATVNKEGDTLGGLAKSITGKANDWKCIWIKSMKNESKVWGTDFFRWIQVGDKFDISNLTTTSGVSATIVFNGADNYLKAVEAIYGGAHATSPFIDQLEKLSGHGETPIRSLTLVGHSSATRMWGDNSNFSPSSFSSELPSHDGTNAMASIGPHRCWFTKNARIRFVGCSSELIAKLMAKNFLRKGAKARGTNSWVCGWHSAPLFGPSMISAEAAPCVWPAKSQTFTNPSGFASAPGVWVTHKGKL